MDGTFVKTSGISGSSNEQMIEKARNRFEEIAQNICGIKAKLADPRCPEDKKRVLEYNLKGLLRAEERDRELLSDFMRL